MMMPGVAQTPRDKQVGSILIITLVVFVGIGMMTAGLMTILHQRSVTLTEDIRMLRGLGVADSYRLALIDERNDSAVQEDLEKWLPDDRFVYSDGGTYIGAIRATTTGAIGATRNRWGYRFIYDAKGVGNGVPKPEGYIDSSNLEACKNDANECKFNQGSEPDPGEKVHFKGDTTLKFNPNADIELRGLIVNGDLTIEASPGSGQGKNPSWLCVSEKFDVGGKVFNFNELSNPPNTCLKPSAELNDKWTFQTSN